MGKKLIEKYIRVRAGFMIFGGIALSIVMGAILYFLIRSGSYGIKLCIILETLILAGALIMFLGIRQSVDPFSADEVRRNPEIFDQAEELFGHEIYKDEFIAMSERVIGSSERKLQMAYKDEVLLIYVFTQKVNGMTQSKLLKLETVAGTINIDIMGERPEKVDELIRRISVNCPYAKAGNTPENIEYLNYARERWKKNRRIGNA
ncbi:MAG: hypothetical protein K6C99_00770 [Lachnospiraceae bacterium]|nr:hypothetical protein [Lachnospiraceae bacterium]